MQQVIEMIMQNPVIAGILTSTVGMFLAFTIYKALIMVVLSDKNIDMLDDAVDKYVDKIQKKNQAAGKLTRARLIKAFESIVARLKKDDGVN